MNIGRHLQQHREQRHMTLRQIADSTKLSTATLQHIEQNELDRLPGGIFVRAYLRSVAIEVGADPDEVVNAYVGQSAVVPLAEEPPPVAMPTSATRLTGRLATAGVALVLALVAYVSFAGPSTPLPATPHPAVLESRPIGLLVREHVVARVSPAVARLEQSERPEKRERPQPAARLEPKGRAKANAGRQSGARAQPGTRRDQGVRLEIAPTRACWVSARADGRRVVRRLVQRGERLVVTARKQLFLYVGKSDGFAYTVNGVPGRPLGEVVKPVTVKITDDNVSSFQVGGAAKELPRAATASDL